jgi:hypothetical protein
MKRLWRRNWPVIVALVAGLAVGIVHIIAWSESPESRGSAGFDNQNNASYDQIEDGLFLGGLRREPPPGTRAVLNVCESEDPYRAEFHRWQPIHDAAPAPSLDWLRQQVEFVDQQRRAGRTVYVHCHAGISRGGMVVVAYLMYREGWSRDETLAFVRKRRPAVSPNPAFMELLQEWEMSTRPR